MGMNRSLLTIVSFTLVLAAPIHAQDCSKQADFGHWLSCRVDARVAAVATPAQKKAAASIGAPVQAKIAASNLAIKSNAKDPARQQDSPAVAGNSNTLVDLSSASDLVNLALNLAKLSPSTTTNNNPSSVSVSTSAYALYAAGNYHDPLDPDFYNRNRPWRRFFLTLGQDIPKTTTGSSTVDPHANRTGTVIGFKALLWNGRDITDPKNAPVFGKVLVQLGHLGIAQDKIRVDLNSDIPDITTRFASLTPAESQQVDQVIDKYVSAFSDMEQVAESAFNEIKNKRQWSLSYSADLRDSQGYNQHSIQSVLDWGVRPRLNWTSNVGVDIYDAKAFGRNRNGGSASTQFQFRITEDPKQTQPILFSLSGYGQWLTNVAPTYKVQGELTIPLGQKTGVSLPISVTYASRTDLIQEAHTEAKFGFTFDAAKIAAALLPSGLK
jgi:hypothetical protein